MVFPIFLRRSRSDERSVIRRSGGKPSERGTSRVSYSSPLAHLLLTSCLPLLTPCSPPDHPFLTPCLPLAYPYSPLAYPYSPLAHPLITPSSLLVYLLLTSCLPLSFPQVHPCHSRKFLAGIQKKEEPHSPSPFAARFRPFACLGVAHRQGRDALPKRECGWKRGKEQTPTGLNTIDIHTRALSLDSR